MRRDNNTSKILNKKPEENNYNASKIIKK